MIAQEPPAERDASRLMVVGADGAVTHRRFTEITDFVRPGDLLVVNDTRVFPARIVGCKADSGGRIELFLLRRTADGLWEALVRPSRRVRHGTRIVAGDGILVAEVREKDDHGRVLAALETAIPEDDAIDRAGRVPLPPYIRREPVPADRERYQTVYALNRGSVAAPTAGFHFTPALLDRAAAMGIERAAVTLHVGLGTFRPLTSETAAGNELHAEYCHVPSETAAAVARCRERGSRVVAVGTTTTRALETAAVDGAVEPFEGWTTLFIKPPYRFRAVDVLVTNFHLPRSSLLVMVSAFAGRDRVLAAYREAVRAGYRFYSYGDAMMIERKS